MEHRIVIASGPNAGQLATVALMLGGLYERANRRFIPVEELMQVMGVTGRSPAPTPEIEVFLAADQALKRAA